MTWIELHDTVIDHPKVLEAADLLDLSNVTVVGHLAALWTWAIDAAPEGGPLSSRSVAAGARWSGDKDVFATALADAGLLDRDGDRFLIHNWGQYSGRLVERREQSRDRARKSREQSAQRTRTVRAPNAPTVPNSTVPNQTEQDRTEPEHQKPPPQRFKANPSSIRTRLWEVYTELTSRLTPPPYEEDQIQHWEGLGCSEEHVSSALRQVAEANPDNRWAFFKARLGEALVKSTMIEQQPPSSKTVRIVR